MAKSKSLARKLNQNKESTEYEHPYKLASSELYYYNDITIGTNIDGTELQPQNNRTLSNSLNCFHRKHSENIIT